MKESLPPLLKWPALTADDADFPDELVYERAVWGKVHNASSDFRWIARSANFAAQKNPLERELSLGSEDVPERCYFWWVANNTYYAGSCYPSKATDANGRSGFLEKQIISWERDEKIPAALGMLLLLSQVSQYTDNIWWEYWDDDNWFDSSFVLSIKTDHLKPIRISHTDIKTVLERGKAQLDPFISCDSLTEFYASILAGNKGVPFHALNTPISAEAMATLFLPLSREIVNGISCVSWLPSKSFNMTQLKKKWTVTLSGEKKIKPSLKVKKPSKGQKREAEIMAQALFDLDPEILSSGKSKSKGGNGNFEIETALWGPSASGKTMYLAKLASLNEHLDGKEKDWRVFLGNKSLDITEKMERKMKIQNRFPVATAVGFKEQITYEFEHIANDMQASLFVEDRAGKDFEERIEEVNKRLVEADGLLLLIDPMRDEEQMKLEISNTLRRLRADSGIKGGKEDRPVAVCFSKSDILIKTPDDLKEALDTPDGFMRRNLSTELVSQFDTFFSKYIFFPVSAAGVHLKRGVIEPTVFIDEKFEHRLSRRGQPVNLLSPFIWLIENIRRG